jgi:hypothetical protein
VPKDWLSSPTVAEGGAARACERAPANSVVTKQRLCDQWQVTFLADESNTHRVTRVLHGERLTLTLWFTLLPMHSEDVKVLQLLPQSTNGALVVVDASPLCSSLNGTRYGVEDRYAQDRLLAMCAM